MAWLLLLSLLGCKDKPCEFDADITPGCGIVVDGAQVRIGDALESLPPARVQDLGDLGSRFTLEGHPVTGRAVEGVVVSLFVHDGYPGTTPTGVGIGSTADQVRATFNDPVFDPFVGHWWYMDQGVGFEWEASLVARVQVFGGIDVEGE